MPLSYIASGGPTSKCSTLRLSASDGKSFPDCGRSVPESGKTFLGGISPLSNFLWRSALRRRQRRNHCRGVLLRGGATRRPRRLGRRTCVLSTTLISVYQLNHPEGQGPPAHPRPQGLSLGAEYCVCVSAVCARSIESQQLARAYSLNTPQRARPRPPRPMRASLCDASAERSEGTIEARRVKTRFLRGLVHESAIRVPTRRRPTTPTADVLPQANGRGSQSRGGTARLWNQAMPMS